MRDHKSNLGGICSSVSGMHGRILMKHYNYHTMSIRVIDDMSKSGFKD